METMKQVRAIYREFMFILVIFEDTLQLAITAIGAGRNECRLLIDERMADVENCLPIKINTDFLWQIDQLVERKNGAEIFGEYFNVRYKMRLLCDWRHNGSNDVCIFLCIYVGESDEDMQWPFERYVTMMITNPQSPNAHRAITNECSIDKPTNNDCQYSDHFTFLYSDLSNAGLLLGNNMIVNCAIDDP